MPITLQIEVPIACFRQSQARQYLETYPVPPPATVYGMLLSLVGETDRYKHCGTCIAIALLSEPKRSMVLRTLHRYKKRNIHHPSNIRPEYQELLTDVRLLVWVDKGADIAQPSLVERLKRAFAEPTSIERFGGLSLGESRDLVNTVTLIENWHEESIRWVIQHDQGSMQLPYWVDHVGSQGSRWLRYVFQESNVGQPPEYAWTAIRSS